MTTVEAPVRLGVDLGGFCDGGLPTSNCTDLAAPLFAQLASGKYDVCATMPLPRSREAWEAEHRTARKRAWKAASEGYWTNTFAREQWAGDIYAINTSRTHRQGRRMDAAYQSPDTSPLPDYPCDLHAIRYYGVFAGVDRLVEPALVAYMQVYRAGDLMLVSQVLGHGDHEDNGIMHLLHRDVLVAEGRIAPGVAVYNRFDSGTPGLRQMKRWVGYEETPVEWLP